MAENELISIGEAAEILGVSISTLRRWDESGQLRAKKSEGGHRLYTKQQLELYLHDLFALAKDWALTGIDIPSRFYCENSSVFQAKLTKLQNDLIPNKNFFQIASLLVAIAGEIGNNSFDHNIGNWPDIPGVFFGYDIEKRIIVLADRGQGVLATLKRVRASLTTHEEALRVAFTEVISGRAPEARGNGLKFVRKVVTENPISLNFQTGNAMLKLIRDGNNLKIDRATEGIRGCLVLITF